jgi:hypothetical protein
VKGSVAPIGPIRVASRAEQARDAARPHRLDVAADEPARLGALVHEDGEGRAARKGLQTHGARSGEQVEHPRAGDRIAVGVDEHVEQSLPQRSEVGRIAGERGPRRGRPRQRPPTTRTGVQLRRRGGPLGPRPGRSAPGGPRRGLSEPSPPRGAPRELRTGPEPPRSSRLDPPPGAEGTGRGARRRARRGRHPADGRVHGSRGCRPSARPVARPVRPDRFRSACRPRSACRLRSVCRFHSDRRGRRGRSSPPGGAPRLPYLRRPSAAPPSGGPPAARPPPAGLHRQRWRRRAPRTLGRRGARRTGSAPRRGRLRAAAGLLVIRRARRTGAGRPRNGRGASSRRGEGRSPIGWRGLRDLPARRPAALLAADASSRLPGRFPRFGAAEGRDRLAHLALEIDSGFGCEPIAELLAQNLGAHLLHKPGSRSPSWKGPKDRRSGGSPAALVLQDALGLPGSCPRAGRA